MTYQVAPPERPGLADRLRNLIGGPRSAGVTAPVRPREEPPAPVEEPPAPAEEQPPVHEED